MVGLAHMDQTEGISNKIGAHASITNLLLCVRAYQVDFYDAKVEVRIELLPKTLSPASSAVADRFTASSRRRHRAI